MIPEIFKNSELWFKLFVLLRRQSPIRGATLLNGVMYVTTDLDGDAYRLQIAYDAFKYDIWMRVEIKKVATKGVPLERFGGSLVDFRICYAFNMLIKNNEGTAINEYELLRHHKYQRRELPSHLDIDAEGVEMVEQIVMRVLLENDMERT